LPSQIAEQSVKTVISLTLESRRSFACAIY